MSKSDDSKPLIHAPALVRVANGHCAGFVNLFRDLASEANKTNAARASVKFEFIGDGETVNAKYVPEITVTVRALED